MAAGTNWKRPWKDDDQLAYSGCPIQNNRLPADISTRQTLSTSDYGAQQDTEEMVSSPERNTHMARGASNILSPSPHRPVGFLTKSKDHRPPSDSPPPDNKRRRIGYTQPQEDSHRRSTAIQEGNNDRESVELEGMAIIKAIDT